MSFSQQETSVRLEGLPGDLVDIDLADTTAGNAVLGNWVALTHCGHVVFGYEAWADEQTRSDPIGGTRVRHAGPDLAVVLDHPGETLTHVRTTGPGPSIATGPHPQELAALSEGRAALTFADQGFAAGPFGGGAVVLDAKGQVLDRVNEVESYGVCRFGEQALVFGLGTRQAVFCGRTNTQPELQRRVTLPEVLRRAVAPTALLGGGVLHVACLGPNAESREGASGYEQLVWTPSTDQVWRQPLRTGAPMLPRANGRYVDVSGDTVVVRQIRIG